MIFLTKFMGWVTNKADLQESLNVNSELLGTYPRIKFEKKEPETAFFRKFD